MSVRPKYLGCDLSLTSTGLVVWNGRRGKWWNLKSTPDHGDVFEGLYARIDRVVSKVHDLVIEFDPVLIVIERPTPQARKKDLRPSELFGCVMLDLKRSGDLSRVETVAANTLKVDATGNHRASKPEMVAAALPYLPDCPNDDVADALHCARYGWGLRNAIPGM